MTMERTYKTRANALRAARRAFGPNGIIGVDFVISRRDTAGGQVRYVVAIPDAWPEVGSH